MKKKQKTVTEVDSRDPAFVEVRENLAREAARDMVVGSSGLVLTNWEQSVDLAKYMSTSGAAVRKELRQNVGMCIAIIELATGWGFKPFQLARCCYVVNDILCFESKVIHAVVEKFAPLKEILRVTYVGEGDERQAIISGHVIGELEPRTYTSQKLGKISPKNSPLWKTDPDQQLFYLSSKRWCDRYFPHILLGVHDIDQADAPSIVPGVDARDVTPRLAERVREFKGEGFSAETSLDQIDAALAAAGVTQIAEEEKK